MLVELFVAGAVDVLFAVALLNPPEPADVVPSPLPADVDPALEREDDVRVLPPEPAEAELAVVVPDVELLAPVAAAPLVELVAILSIAAPRPALPAEALPLDDPPRLEPDEVVAVIVGVLVKVAPAVEESVPVLLRVCPEVTVEDCDGLDGRGTELGVGSVTTPAPTWPCPPLPGVAPPTGSVAVGFTVCAAAGTASAKPTAANAAKNAFMLRRHDPRGRVPTAGCGAARLLRS